MRRRHILGYGVLLLALVLSVRAGIGAQGPSTPLGAGATWEWRTYGADLASTRYAPLDQINQANFKDLEVAWRFKTDALGPRPE
jgi:quinoprotein glucose dehydrogenase